MRRSDGKCPRCGLRPRDGKRSYCVRCDNDRRRELVSGMRLPNVPGSDLERRYNVLRMMCAGKVTKQIAVAMGIQPRTVKHYIAWLRASAKARTPAQLAVWGVANGIVEIPKVTS